MALSDMMKHYFTIKERYKDCIVFYRLGDFYEMFFDDAVEASAILELTLTGRDCGLNERAPMCGIPYHAAQAYLAKLVNAGKKVAVCEQLTEPNGKGLVERDVVRVVTSGTLIEDNLVDEKTNNYIASIYSSPEGFSLAWADITTGEFTVREMDDNERTLFDCLYLINPAEIIANGAAAEVMKRQKDAFLSRLPSVSRYKESAFSFGAAKSRLLSQFNVLNLNAFLPETKKLSVCAAGALIEYFGETQMRALKNIEKIVYFDDSEFVLLDQTAVRNLELVKSMRDGKVFGTLLWAIDFTSTSMGARKIRDIILSPLKDAKKIEYRLDGVEALSVDNSSREAIRETLGGVRDIERLAGRVSNNIATPRDLENLEKSLESVPALKFVLLGKNAKILQDIHRGMGDFTELCGLLKSMLADNPPVSIKEGGFVRDGFDEKLDKLRSLQKNGRQTILEIEARERAATGIKGLKINYNKVLGYYIEVTKSFLAQVPYSYIRKQTLVGCERYVTEELKSFEDEILSCNEKIIRLENQIFENIKALILSKLSDILKCARSMAMLDVLLSFATVAKKRGYCRPQIAESELNIVGGRHPVIEAVSKEKFVPNDTYLDCEENRMMIITGPNMAGKSTYMRQVALIAVLAHIGSFVPAKSAEIPILDKIFTRVGASDNLIFDQSTFMVEMTEVANILANATKNSLLILDEVGRGTSTYDGLSIAWSVVEFLAESVRAKTLFATHYHELSELEGRVEGVKNYKITVREFNGTILFTRKIMRGSVNKSFGVEVASLAGVPSRVTKRAKQLLKLLERKDLNQKAAMQDDLNEPIGQTELPDFIREVKELDINSLTPIKAFEILNELKEKLNDKN